MGNSASMPCCRQEKDKKIKGPAHGHAAVGIPSTHGHLRKIPFSSQDLQTPASFPKSLPTKQDRKRLGGSPESYEKQPGRAEAGNSRSPFSETLGTSGKEGTSVVFHTLGYSDYQGLGLLTISKDFGKPKHYISKILFECPSDPVLPPWYVTGKV